jgi:hypothetical protein
VIYGQCLLLPTVAVMVLAAGCASQTQQPILGDEESFDGLRRVENSRASAAWIRPDIDWSSYTKVRLEGAGVAFRPLTRTGPTARQFPVTEAQQQRLKEILSEAFTEELANSTRFELVRDPGPDVLTVWGELEDVVSNVPPERAGRDRIYLDRVGAATLVLELRDSQSNAALARAVDRRAASRAGGTTQLSSSVSNWAEVRRVARRWATMLRERLDAADNWNIAPP